MCMCVCVRVCVCWHVLFNKKINFISDWLKKKTPKIKAFLIITN